MIPSNCHSVTLEAHQTASSSGDTFAYLDTKSYDYAIFEIFDGTHEAAETAVEILRMGESDTIPTDVTTDCDVIPALSCGAAVAASCLNILPAASSTKQNIYRFNIDLRGRKRYLAVDFTPTTQTVSIDFIAHLFRNNEGGTIATVATTSDGFRLIASV